MPAPPTLPPPAEPQSCSHDSAPCSGPVMADCEQVRKACQALLDHDKKWRKIRQRSQKDSLFHSASSVPLFLQISLNAMPEKQTLRPRIVELRHPLQAEEDNRLCLLVRADERKALMAAAAEANIPNLKVMPLEKLRGKYKAFEAKRELVKRFDTFVTSPRDWPVVRDLCGKTFTRGKNQPACLDVKAKNLKDQVAYIRSCTKFVISGTSCTLQVGNMDMAVEQLVENVTAAIEGAAKALASNRLTFRELMLKTDKSPALTVYKVCQKKSATVE